MAEKIERAVRKGKDASWSHPQYCPTWDGLTFEMAAHRGAVLVDAFRRNLNVYRHDWQPPNWVYWDSDMDPVIRENRTRCVTGRDGLRAVAAD